MNNKLFALARSTFHITTAIIIYALTFPIEWIINTPTDVSIK